MTHRPFRPARDTEQLIHRLLDVFERRRGEPKQVVRVRLQEIQEALPGYYSQTDPVPRTVTNEQLGVLAHQGWIVLHWEPGQENHLLAAIDLAPEAVAGLYLLVEREPLAAQRIGLRNLLLGQRFRVQGWRRLAIDDVLEQIQADKSPSPFVLGDESWNRDLLEALVALPENPDGEIPYRVFSVRVFNDSKRFDTLQRAIAGLARRRHSQWRDLTNPEILRELGLVPNPGHLYLSGPWRLTDSRERVISLNAFHPAVGIPAALATQVTQVSVEARQIICVENLTTFYELIRRGGEDLAALCLLGNPSPACRHLLSHLARTVPEHVPLYVWADLDYGGLNILSQLRRTVSPRFQPYRMDKATLASFAYWGQPVTAQDRTNLTRLRHDPHLMDMVGVIDALLAGDVKLEQEAIILQEV